jgi:hypothetical protein
LLDCTLYNVSKAVFVPPLHDFLHNKETNRQNEAKSMQFFAKSEQGFPVGEREMGDFAERFSGASGLQQEDSLWIRNYSSRGFAAGRERGDRYA